MLNSHGDCTRTISVDEVKSGKDIYLFLNSWLNMDITVAICRYLALACLFLNARASIIDSITSDSRTQLLNFKNYTAAQFPTTSIRCEPIAVEDCRSLHRQYEYTLLPNSFGDQTQLEASITLDYYREYFRSTCAHLLQLFVCLNIFPPCSGLSGHHRQLPCRHVCEYVVAQCSHDLSGVEDAYEIFDCRRYFLDDRCLEPLSWKWINNSSTETTGVNANFRFDKRYLQSFLSCYRSAYSLLCRIRCLLLQSYSSR